MPKNKKEKVKKQELKSERPKQIDEAMSPSKTSLSSLDSPIFSKKLLKPEKLETIQPKIGSAKVRKSV